MNFYIADLHIGHTNILRLSQRPFADCTAMYKAICNNWNARVRPTDDVYILGDLFFKTSPQAQLEMLRSLKGTKHLIMGNHDRDFNADVRKEFASIRYYDKIIDNGRKVVLCHYPMLEWDGFFRDTYHLFGHIHNNFATQTYRIIKSNPEHFRNAYNVGADVIGFTPRTLDELIQMRKADNTHPGIL